MGLFDDLSRFLETRLEEFLRSNPHLELQALEEQLREQQEDTLRLIADLQKREQKLQGEILTTAQDIQRWHERSAKAKAANRLDLLQGAQEREAALLRHGNQIWGQMQGVKERIEQSKTLYHQIQQRLQEVREKAAQVTAGRATQTQSAPNSATQGWNQSAYTPENTGGDQLEEKFKQWETEAELEEMKRNLR